MSCFAIWVLSLLVNCRIRYWINTFGSVRRRCFRALNAQQSEGPRGRAGNVFTSETASGLVGCPFPEFPHKKALSRRAALPSAPGSVVSAAAPAGSLEERTGTAFSILKNLSSTVTSAIIKLHLCPQQEPAEALFPPELGCVELLEALEGGKKACERRAVAHLA